MNDHRPVDPAKLQRQKRLEAQLRDNLRRRKAAAVRPKAEDRSEATSELPEAPQPDET